MGDCDDSFGEICPVFCLFTFSIFGEVGSTAVVFDRTLFTFGVVVVRFGDSGRSGCLFGEPVTPLMTGFRPTGKVYLNANCATATICSFFVLQDARR